MRVLFLALALFPYFIKAQDFPAKPTNYVTDNADVMTPEQEEKLNKKLHDYEKQTTNQLFVYTAGSLNNQKIESFSRTIFNTWGIGQKDKNNGILIAVFTDDRKF